MKVTVISDSANLNTGYGRIAKNIGYHLAKNHGHEVSFIGFQFRGSPMILKIKDMEFDFYSGISARQGNVPIVVNKSISHIKPDATIFIRDPVHFTPEKMVGGEGYSLSGLKPDIKLVSWIPIMSGYMDTAVKDNLIKSSDRIVTFSEYGRVFLQNIGVPYNLLSCVNPGFDETTFKKTSPYFTSKGTVFGFVGLLKDQRKQFANLLLAFKHYLKNYDSQAMLYLHSSITGVAYDIPSFADALNLKGHIIYPQENGLTTYSPEWGFTDEEMASVYSSFNLTVSMSGQEGFNLPFLESLACETPVLGIYQPSYDWSDQIQMAPSIEAVDTPTPAYGYISDPYVFAEYMDRAKTMKVNRKKLMGLTWTESAKKMDHVLRELER